MSVGYSPIELDLIALLKKRKRLTVLEMVALHYGDDERARPFHAQQTIRSALYRLQKKMAYNKEPFQISLEKQLGRNMVYVFGKPEKARPKKYA